MTTGFSLHGWLLGLGRSALRWFTGGWQVVFLVAQLVVLAFTPSSYRAKSGSAVLRHIYEATAPGLPGFTVLMALFNVVLIRIVVVTAFAYGLTQYALDAVVRVLVMELVPLFAALFVAVEYSIPGGTDLYKMRRAGTLETMRQRGVDPLSHEVLPRALGGMCAVLMLAQLSCLVSLVLAYVAVHGFTLAGLPSYNHAVGNIFNPVVTTIFVCKTLAFAMAVALLPLANALRDVPQRSRISVELQGLVHMFVLMLVIEAASLMGNYY